MRKEYENQNVLCEIQRPLDQKKVDERGIMVVHRSGHPVRVSPAMLPKAINLLESLLIRLVELGSSLPQIDYGERAYQRLEVEWQGFKYLFQIEETSKRFENSVDEIQKALIPIERMLEISAMK